MDLDFKTLLHKWSRDKDETKEYFNNRVNSNLKYKNGVLQYILE